MTARAWLRHADGGGRPVTRSWASRKGERRFVGPEDKDPALPIPQVAPSAQRERVEPGEPQPSRRRPR